MAENEERKRCKECGRLKPVKKVQLNPFCKLCKKPLIKTGRFYVCSDKDMSHRRLIPAIKVKAAAPQKEGAPFEV